MGLEQRICCRDSRRHENVIDGNLNLKVLRNGNQMIRITQLKLPLGHTEEDFRNAIAKALRIPLQKIDSYTIVKKSIDARKGEIKYIYTADVTLRLAAKENEDYFISKCRNTNVSSITEEHYSFCPSGTQGLLHRPVVVGTGPAGLFAAYLLAKHGYQPLVLERGEEVQKRVASVEQFWSSGLLKPESNVQFGEGGAGTFSDGKLNTLVKDANHRYRLVMETFVHCGAPSDILYLNKPHIGTDQLRKVVENMRREIISCGGEVRFNTKLTELVTEEGTVKAVILDNKEQIPCEALILAIGHSARDTFSMLTNHRLFLSPKPFAVGLRIEHKQSLISQAQYGSRYQELPPADYKLTHQTRNGRGVYSFCMCPGGFVVNASSEQGYLAVNGMSNYLRNEDNANSAIVVTVQPEDFGQDGPLAGVAFQRQLEQTAYEAGKGAVPVQLFGDLLNNRDSVTIGNVTPNIKGAYRLTNLNSCLPKEILEALKEGILAFDHKIKGFANEEAILAGVESRTSSPVRIHRDERFEANIKGIYPCGEGAGYAGGITSAAIDGIKVFEAIADRYKAR